MCLSLECLCREGKGVFVCEFRMYVSREREDECLCVSLECLCREGGGGGECLCVSLEYLCREGKGVFVCEFRISVSRGGRVSDCV